MIAFVVLFSSSFLCSTILTQLQLQVKYVQTTFWCFNLVSIFQALKQSQHATSMEYFKKAKIIESDIAVKVNQRFESIL